MASMTTSNEAKVQLLTKIIDQKKDLLINVKILKYY